MDQNTIDALRKIQASLDRIERHLVADEEIRSLGHRIVYDRQTGESLNGMFGKVDPALLDEHGLRIRIAR